MRQSLMIGAALVAFALAQIGASAAAFTRTYDVAASDFETFAGAFGPTQLFAASYTLSFDPSADVAPTVLGLTVNFDSFPATTEFAYAVAGDSLAIGSQVDSGNAIGTVSGQYGLFIDDATSATPFVNEVFYQTVDGFFASNVQTVVIATTSAAPEPAGWALMLIAVGVAGAALRHRRARTWATAV